MIALWLGLALAQEPAAPVLHALPEKRERMSRTARESERQRITLNITEAEAAIFAQDGQTALPLAWAAAEGAIRAVGDEDALTINALHALGRSAMLVEDYDLAYDVMLRSLAPRVAMYGTYSQTVVVCLWYLAQIELKRGHQFEALASIEQAVTIARGVYGEGTVEVVQYTVTYAEILGVVGRAADKEALYEWCVAVQEQMGRTRTIETANCLLGLGSSRIERGDTILGRIHSERGFALAEALLPPDDIGMADALYRLADARSAEGRQAEALTLINRALAIQRNIGLRPTELATTLNLRGNIYGSMARYGEAELDHLEAIEIVTRAHGPEHPDLVTQYANLARIRLEADHYEPALEASLLASELGNRVLGPDHASTVYAETVHVEALHHSGRLTEAYATGTALVARTTTQSGDRFETAAALQALVATEYALGKLAEARAHLDEAMRILEALGGQQSYFLFSALSTAGVLAMESGDLEFARRHLERADELATLQLGTDHPTRVPILANLAMLEWSEGDVITARQRYDDAIELSIATMGPDNAQLEYTYRRRGDLLLSLGDGAAARVDIERGRAIRDASYGPDTPQALYGRMQDAELLGVDGRWAEAEVALRSVLADIERVIGTEVRDVADVRFQLGLAIGRQGRYDDAIVELTAAVAIYGRLGHANSEAHSWGRIAELHLGAGRFDEADRAISASSKADPRLDNNQIIAMIRLAQGRPQEASDHALSAYRTLYTDLADQLAFSGDRERIGRVNELADVLGLWLVTTGAAGADVEEQWTAVLAHKGLATRTVQTRRTASPELALVRRQLSTLAYDADAPHRAERMIALSTEKERLERASGTATAAEITTPRDVCKGLPDDTLFVDYFRRSGYGPAAYVAYVAERRDGTCRTQRVDLGAAADIDTAIDRWRDLALSDTLASRVDAQGAAVRKLLWDPIAPFSTAHHVWVSPDSAIATVSFAGLPLGRGRYLVHEREFASIDHASDALRATTAATGGTLVVGGVDFGAGVPDARSCVGALAPLPGTVLEGERIAAAFDRAGLTVERLIGSAATESAVRERFANRKVAHIATHGFFASASCRTAGPGDRAGAIAMADFDLVAGLDPMVLSGIALAGANDRFSAGDDGLMTADELAGADLQGTDLVVLSACESGLGESRTGEGVMGLRRGLSLAGADGVVLSLWSVPDAETLRLMELFYEAMLGKGQTPAHALRTAELALIDEQVAAYGSARLQDWAGFVASGPGVLRYAAP